jgi:DNA-binding MarR family transcriptional regulator
MNEVINIAVGSDDLVRRYLELRTFYANTEMEYAVWSEIVKRGSIRTAERREIQNLIGLTQHSFNNIINKLKNKDCIRRNSEDNSYYSTMQLPENINTLSFKFDIL